MATRIVLPIVYLVVATMLIFSGAGHGPGAEQALMISRPSSFIAELLSDSIVSLLVCGAVQYFLIGWCIDALISRLRRG